MRHPLRVLSLLFALCMLLAACGTGSTTASSGATATPQPVTLNIFAASSLTASFNEIKTNYQHAHAGITIVNQFAGSQALVQQIINGANADVFASADEANMQKAITPGLVDKNQVHVFARNKLVVIVPASNPANITSLQDLAKHGVKLVVGASSVPVGTYALKILDNLGKAAGYGASYESSVKANIVSQEDQVTAVVQKVALGEADAGIVYQTDVTPAEASKVKVIAIPDAFNVIAEYPIAALKGSTHATEAQAFVNYILSSDGQATLTKYHFIGVNGSGTQS